MPCLRFGRLASYFYELVAEVNGRKAQLFVPSLEMPFSLAIREPCSMEYFWQFGIVSSKDLTTSSVVGLCLGFV